MEFNTIVNHGVYVPLASRALATFSLQLSHQNEKH